MTAEIPAVVRTTIAALRTAATWLPDEQRDLLYEAATVAENGGWEDACCPICQETWCDTGCPLEDLRNELLRKAEQVRTIDPPVVLPKGSGVKLIWPDWRPFHHPVPTLRDAPHRRAVLPVACYDASFGRVHVRPGCRC